MVKKSEMRTILLILSFYVFLFGPASASTFEVYSLHSRVLLEVVMNPLYSNLPFLGKVDCLKSVVTYVVLEFLSNDHYFQSTRAIFSTGFPPSSIWAAEGNVFSALLFSLYLHMGTLLAPLLHGRRNYRHRRLTVMHLHRI